MARVRRVLCKDEKSMYSCQVEIGDGYIVLKTLKTWRRYKIGIESIENLVLDEISGKLTIKLSYGETIEIQPQTVDDRDAISSLLLPLTAAPDSAIFDSIGGTLRAFHRAATAITKLSLALSGSTFVNWKKLYEVSRELVDAVRLGRNSLASSAIEEMERVLESIAHRDSVELLRSLRSAVVSLYESTKLDLARALPGSSSEAVLDLVLASALNSATKSLDLSPSEKETVNSSLAAALRRFSRVFRVKDRSYGDLEALLFSQSSSEEFVSKLLEELKKSLAQASAVFRK